MMKELVLRASGKTTAKMLEEASDRLELAESSLKAAGFTQASPSNQWKPPVGPSASPMLQRIDDLSTQRDELLRDMQDVLDMLINQPHAVTAANQAEDMLRLSIGTAKYFAKAWPENHSPDIAKMVVPEGWQLVPVEPTIEMVQAATNSAVGFGTRAAYQAMLSAAPKPEGGEA